MSVIICPRCTTQPSEKALYCQECGIPIRCQKCHAGLSLTARHCDQCGHLIPERSSPGQFHADSVNIIPGYNRLRLHETPDVREVDLLLSDTAVEQIRDIIPPFITTRSTSGHRRGTANFQQNGQSDVVEVAPDMSTSPQPEFAMHPVQPVLPEKSLDQRLWEIFTKREDGKFVLDVLELKAGTKKEYIIRLVVLYLYAKFQTGSEKVLREEVYKMLIDVGVEDTNTSKYISQDTGIQSEDKMLRLNSGGRKRAQGFISDVFNEDLSDSWYPGSDNRSSSSRVKKSVRKTSEKRGDTGGFSAEWLSHEITLQLNKIITHGAVSDLSKLDQSLLALYGIYKVGHEEYVSPSLLVQYLEKVFKVSAQANSLRMALVRAIEGKTRYVNSNGRQGYIITPSGLEYIEDLLKQERS